MTTADPSPFSLEGEDGTGFLLLHGLTGSPAEMRALGADLNARGHPVVAPCLPGHGTRVEDLRPVARTDWIDHAAAELDALRARCDRVVVGALSMGSLVGAHLAARQHVDGLFVMAPALEVRLPVPIWFARGLRYVWAYAAKPPSTDSPRVEAECWSYDRMPLAALDELGRLQAEAARVLPEVTAPSLVFGGALDDTVPAPAVSRYFQLLGSDDKSLVWMPDSGHVVPLDNDREDLFDRVADFGARVSR